jgi:glycerophosphoryl diester phosphodiesterase/predicted amidohydrolase
MPQMKVCIIQPLYSADYERSEELFRWQLEAMDQCDESMDLIVLPEATSVPALAKTLEQFHESYEKYNEIVLTKAAQTAKRCHSVLFINALYDSGKGLRNTTYAFDREGNVVGHYFKQHPTNGEVFKRKMDCDYSYEFSNPTVIEIEGLRYCFLTCYDFYFYEIFPNIARQRPDIIIGCSHQRSDRQDALSLMSRFLAYNTNAYVVRSSVSMDESSEIGGGSTVVAPDGRVIVDMGSRVGMETCIIDPTKKYYKPAGYGNPDSAHFEYIEVGRRPWKYRPAGSAIILPDERLSYPRLCAHRGFNTVCPENSMPAFGAAVSLGAPEIEFDLWETKDHQIVSIHDSSLDRVSDGTGKVWDYTLSELQTFDFGKGFEGAYKGLRIVTFEDILQKFACHVVMNIHIKSFNNVDPMDETYLKKIISTIRKYDCEKYVYFMTGNDVLMHQLGDLAPDIARCVGGGNAKDLVVERAIEMGCEKVQLFAVILPRRRSSWRTRMAFAAMCSGRMIPRKRPSGWIGGWTLS